MPDTPVRPVSPAPKAEAGREYRRSRWKSFRGRLRSWARGTFSRESLVSSVKSLLWVVPLTVLIWVYAEREQVVKQSNQGFTVEVHSTDPSRVVTLLSPAGGLMHADLMGPQGGIDEVRKWLESGPVSLDIDHNFTPNADHPIPADVLNNQPRLKQAGVSISNFLPTELLVHVDAIAERDGVKVAASQEDLKKLAAPPVFTPDRVRITAPQAVLDEAEARARAAGQELVVYADLRQFKEMAQEGKHTLSAVPLAPSMRMEGPNVKISPATVSAQIDVRRNEKELTLDNVPVWAAYPPVANAEKFRADKYSEVLRNVVVVGPPDEIEQFRQQILTQGTPPAYFFVQGSDLINTAGDHSAPLYFQLPPGIKPKDPNQKITFSVVPRGGE